MGSNNIKQSAKKPSGINNAGVLTGATLLGFLVGVSGVVLLKLRAEKQKWRRMQDFHGVKDEKAGIYRG